MSGSGSDLVSPGTARAIDSGRESIGVLLSTAQDRLQHVFIAFVVGLLAGIFVMRLFIWPTLEADLLPANAEVIAQTPFEVILMQVKIGLFAGVLAALPVLAYHAKRPLQDRDIVPPISVTRWQLGGVLVIAAGLAALGVLYAYFAFFPLMFQFLAGNADTVGLSPKYSIVKWTEFILFLSLSFSLAAQLPLLMSGLSYSGIVAYETFRDKWRYAIVAIATFGALFSPPDPFTQILWATPLVLLYGLSLYVSKIVVTVKRGRDDIDVRGVFRAAWNRILGVVVLGFGAGYAVEQYNGIQLFNDGLAALGSGVRVPTVERALGVPTDTAVLVLGAAFAALAVLAATLYYLYVAVDRAAARNGPRSRRPDPADIDLNALDAAGIEAAPPEAFAALSEDDALATASRAMDDGDDRKAELVLDRFDAAAADDDDTGSEADDPDAESSATMQRTAAGMMDAFTEDDTTEDDIGGYYHDLRFIFDSLRSRAFRIVGGFMLVMVGVFGWLYYGGLATLRYDFITRIPQEIQPDANSWPITLHPVEALVFQVKLSVVIAAVAVVPLLVYYLWPSLSERGLVTGDRSTILAWGGSLAVTLVGGSYLGYAYIAPAVISFLVGDALQAGMVISYTIGTFAWLVFLLTVGIGLLASIPVTMVLFNHGSIVSFDTMRRRWRVPVLATFFFAALATPDSLYTMFIVALPVATMYGLGLAILYALTLGGRRGGDSRSTPT